VRTWDAKKSSGGGSVTTGRLSVSWRHLKRKINPYTGLRPAHASENPPPTIRDPKIVFTCIYSSARPSVYHTLRRRKP
jgi:hypothetical protein